MAICNSSHLLTTTDCSQKHALANCKLSLWKLSTPAIQRIMPFSQMIRLQSYPFGPGALVGAACGRSHRRYRRRTPELCQTLRLRKLRLGVEGIRDSPGWSAPVRRDGWSSRVVIILSRSRHSFGGGVWCLFSCT